MGIDEGCSGGGDDGDDDGDDDGAIVIFFRFFSLHCAVDSGLFARSSQFQNLIDRLKIDM